MSSEPLFGYTHQEDCNLNYGLWMKTVSKAITSSKIPVVSFSHLKLVQMALPAYHGPKFGNLLERWAKLVALGHWEVDKEGVMGGLEKFKGADTEDFYNMHQILTNW
ncbi:hypothetical protein HYALB_00008378 [Hymenoscyphus albidus]|uniref:Uncharacterized protein n=1 Tax=Hymenoscyphus albidus TaxID=595503 RepID=A0A9N9LU68_9HELO|nr:hypothetical protein HYALB_00008378 [Hymenoscyphus albidus]